MSIASIASSSSSMPSLPVEDITGSLIFELLDNHRSLEDIEALVNSFSPSSIRNEEGQMKIVNVFIPKYGRSILGEEFLFRLGDEVSRRSRTLNLTPEHAYCLRNMYFRLLSFYDPLSIHLFSFGVSHILHNELCSFSITAIKISDWRSQMTFCHVGSGPPPSHGSPVIISWSDWHKVKKWHGSGGVVPRCYREEGHPAVFSFSDSALAHLCVQRRTAASRRLCSQIKVQGVFSRFPPGVIPLMVSYLHSQDVLHFLPKSSC